MGYERDKEIVFRPLYESPIISVHDYCCHIEQGGPGGEEISDANNIVLMRHGAFARHFGRRTVTADVNQAVFFSRESTYRVSHPADCGDRGTVFTLLVFPSTALNQTQDPSTPQKKFYKHDRVIPNRYIVVLKDNVVSNDDSLEVRRAKVTAIADSHARTYGGKFDYVYETALKGYAIELPNEAAAIAISNLPEVQFVEEDAIGTVDGAFPKSSNSVCRGKAIPVSELDVGGLKPAKPNQRTLFQASILQRSRGVIRNRDEFSKFWEQLLGTSSHRPPPPEVDFSREMIIVAAMGQQPSSGYQIVIDGACEVNNRLEVFVRSMNLAKCGGLQLGVVTAPVHIVRLPQTQLPVVFQETEVSDCKSLRP